MIDITGKNALVTGSSRGVGQQIALGLAEQGCNIVLHGRTMKSNQHTVELLKAYDVKTYVVNGDLSDNAAIDELIEQVNALGISIDILFNNAAIMKPFRDDIWAHPVEDWMETYQVNVVAMYRLCSAFIPSMVKNRFGRVVNLTSGIMDKPELSHYGASKWAVRKLTEDLAFALKDTGVRINHLDPGWLKTDMGGENAENPVEAVIPGALVPVLIENDGPNGQFFAAMDYKNQGT